MSSWPEARDDDERRAPAERAVRRSLVDGTGIGRPLSRAQRQRQRTVEGYLRGQVLPRYVERARDLEAAVAEHERRLERAHRHLRMASAGDPEGFARAWTERLATWDFSAVNRLVREHNLWYPVERDLPMDPRTGDYVPVNGRSHRRRELDVRWALERWPASTPGS